jgi:bacterioferritin-associated ferredoxin
MIIIIICISDIYRDVYFMIICICNNVNSATIKSSIDMGAGTVQAVREATSAAACCGKCQFKVHSLIQDHVVDSSQLLKQTAIQA